MTYQPVQLAEFTLSEFIRGLQGVTGEEARVRLTKASGTEMNAISWDADHIATHWAFVTASAKGEPVPAEAERYFGPAADPSPPDLTETLNRLDDAVREMRDWVASADDALFEKPTFYMNAEGEVVDENIGAGLMRVILHTWFHAGEINSIRQMLGHSGVEFVGAGVPEWTP